MTEDEGKRQGNGRGNGREKAGENLPAPLVYAPLDIVTKNHIFIW